MDNESKERYNKVFHVFDYVNTVEGAILRGIPLDKRVADELYQFNKYELDNEISRLSKQEILVEINYIKGILEGGKVIFAIHEGIGIVQKLIPNTVISPFSVYLIYAGGNTDARAMLDGFVLNFGNIAYSSDRIQGVLELIKSISAHETIHRVIEQLGCCKDSDEDSVDEFLNDIWEEGLATYVQTVQYDSHHIFMNDMDFYIGIIKEWLNAEESNKKNIVKRIEERDSFKEFYANQGDLYRQNILECTEIDTKFYRMMYKANGPLYHVGYCLWKDKIEKGEDIEKLIKGGHKQVQDWLKEYNK